MPWLVLAGCPYRLQIVDVDIIQPIVSTKVVVLIPIRGSQKDLRIVTTNAADFEESIPSFFL